MSNQRSREGYLLIDHSASPGISREEARIIGAIPVGEGERLEAPTFTCSHCNGIVIMNPDRKRERAYCGKCDSRICDTCGAAATQTGECHSFIKKMDVEQEFFLKSQPIGGIVNG